MLKNPIKAEVGIKVGPTNSPIKSRNQKWNTCYSPITVGDSVTEHAAILVIENNIESGVKVTRDRNKEY